MDMQSGALHLLPVAAYICDINGVLGTYNDRAAELWGRRPIPGHKDERYNGAYRLYHTNGAWLPHDQAPAAACLKDGLPRNGIELIIERPDASRVYVSTNIAPLTDGEGRQSGIISCFYDITAQKNTEKELQRKALELQDYVDNANVGLHWVNADGIIKWANQAELDMLGYASDEYIGHHIAEFHVSSEKSKDILGRLHRKQALNKYESELRCRDGSVKTVHINSSVFREAGEFIHTRCFTIDVTEEKKLFRALSESELRYRQVIQALDAPLYTTDTSGRITLFNKAAATLWGREPEIGKDFWCGSFKIQNTDGSSLPLDTCPMAVCLKEERPVYGEEIVVIRPDGSLRHVAPHPQPTYDNTGKMTGAINMLIDVTNLKNKEKALLESEERYRALAKSLENDVAETIRELKKSEDRYHKMVEEVEDYAIILLDSDGIIRNWNKGAERIKGYREEEIVGKSFQEFYFPEDRQKGLPLVLLRQARATGKAIHEGWRKRKDGTAFWGSIVLTALHDDAGNIIGFSKVTRDLTERKLAEDQLKEYLVQLEFQNKELEQFVYAASHDLKEPLRKIQLYNSFVAENPLNVLDEKSKEYLARSVSASERMKGLIEDLLTYSRATSNVEGYDDVDVSQVMDELLLFHKDELDQKNVRIETKNTGIIRAIPFQVKQLMSNLIDNAVKYRHPGRKTIITVRHEKVNGNTIMEYKADAGKQYHKISVADNGIGFDAKYAGKIFEIFQRLNHSDGINGSGIGLAICKKIVQNHNGFIKAAGKPGEGACFVIYLPS